MIFGVISGQWEKNPLQESLYKEDERKWYPGELGTQNVFHPKVMSKQKLAYEILGLEVPESLADVRT